MRYKCTLQYNGARYAGSQRQQNANTIQNEIERALKRIYNDDITIHLSSRTDKGVHALMQVFHYDTEVDISTHKLALVINRQLPDDIHITSAVRAADDFHARYDARRKTYQYKIKTSNVHDVFTYNTVYQYAKPIDIERLNAFAGNFIGEHEFKAFMAAGSDKEMTVRTIYAIEFKEDGDTVTMSITGSGFLYHMVRIMVGMFLDYNEGKKDAPAILEHFKDGNRSYFKDTAPACALYLAEIRYSD